MKTTSKTINELTALAESLGLKVEVQDGSDELFETYSVSVRMNVEGNNALAYAHSFNAIILIATRLRSAKQFKHTAIELSYGNKLGKKVTIASLTRTVKFYAEDQDRYYRILAAKEEVA